MAKKRAKDKTVNIDKAEQVKVAEQAENTSAAEEPVQAEAAAKTGNAGKPEQTENAGKSAEAGTEAKAVKPEDAAKAVKSENAAKTGAERKVTRHTWVGDVSEEQHIVDIKSTRVVERTKKPYTGFITDEELKDSDVIKLEDRRTRLVEKQDIKQTRIYEPVAAEGTGKAGKGTGAEGAKIRKVKARPRVRNIVIADEKKFKRLIAVVVVFVLLAAFELSYVLMKRGVEKLPAQTEDAKARTEALLEENSGLEEEISGYDDYDQIKESKESWERLRTKIEQSESATE